MFRWTQQRWQHWRQLCFSTIPQVSWQEIISKKSSEFEIRFVFDSNKFQFRWFEIIIVEIKNRVWIYLMFNLLKWKLVLIWLWHHLLFHLDHLQFGGLYSWTLSIYSKRETGRDSLFDSNPASNQLRTCWYNSIFENSWICRSWCSYQWNAFE